MSVPYIAHMETRRSFGAGLATVFLFAVLSSTAAASGSPSKDISASFSLEGSDGYEITGYGEGNYVMFLVSPGSSTAQNLEASDYLVRGSMTPDHVEANFGAFGEISMQFVPSGEVRTKELGKRCSPRRVVRRLGTFVGTARFYGENGYTTVEATEAKGSVGTPEFYVCVGSVTREGHHGHHGGFAPTAVRASTENHRTLFAAARLTRSHALFTASLKERAEAVSIWRFVSVAGPAAGFTFDRKLTTATVAPPQPFAGTATFERGPGGSRPSWSGSLSVSFPGAPEVPLTGANFTSVMLGRF